MFVIVGQSAACWSGSSHDRADVWSRFTPETWEGGGWGGGCRQEVSCVLYPGGSCVSVCVWRRGKAKELYTSCLPPVKGGAKG